MNAVFFSFNRKYQSALETSELHRLELYSDVNSYLPKYCNGGLESRKHGMLPYKLLLYYNIIIDRPSR
jgi:hypothetical protein